MLHNAQQKPKRQKALMGLRTSPGTPLPSWSILLAVLGTLLDLGTTAVPGEFLELDNIGQSNR